MATFASRRIMKNITDTFDKLDAWRHFPNYQLERRADIFFALYLPEVLEKILGIPIQNKLIPEFPVRIGTIYPEIKTDKSYKIDYVACSAQADKAFLVELKTENLSLRPGQDKYLKAAKNKGLPLLLEGLMEIFRATNSKRKYFCLLKHIESMGLIILPDLLKEIMDRTNLQGANEASKAAEITTNPAETKILYVLPNSTNPDNITFHEFAKIVQQHNDPFSQRFAQSLLEWAEVKAGEGKRTRRFT